MPTQTSTGPLRLSLSQPYTLRWSGIRYNDDGGLADPRNVFTPQFQLVTPGAASFGTWEAGTWDGDAPPTGPFAARVTIGPGAPSPINPGVAGTYVMMGRLWQPAGETPTFTVRTIILETP